MNSPFGAFGLRSLVALAALGFASCGGSDGPRYATEFVMVDVSPSMSATAKLALQACAGLANRELGGSVYVRTEANDDDWLTRLELTPSETIDGDTFLERCGELFPRCVRYSYETQQALLPNVLTVGAVLGALPLDENLTVACEDVVFDARAEFETANLPDTATQLVLDRYGSRTTGLAMLNPGYEIGGSDLSNPQLTRDMPMSLVDYVFSERLFTLFLVNGCQPFHPEYAVMTNVATSGHFPTPIGVYGYNNSWLIGGYLYEAQTDCIEAHNMGAIPTETGNLSFFSTRRAPIRSASELPPVATETVTYDPDKTYVAFVVGDGDNVAYVMSSRKAWLAERIAECSSPSSDCAPLSWSLSPHIDELAPDVLAWYAETTRATGRDFFILPPSGHLYAYPTTLNAADQDRFIAATEEDARLLGTHGVVHWDLNRSWTEARASVLPKYAHAGGQIQAIVPVNVPYLYDAFPDWPADKFYEVITGEDGTPLVVFRPRQWRGIDEREPVYFLSPANMAAQLGAHAPGTITVIYMTSDGGLSLANSFGALVAQLPSHVEVVSVDAAARLAIEASGN